jgi:ABC-type transport system involved in multi-copper enzyme maturation permease subunit
MRIFLAEWRKLRRPTLFFGSIGAVIFVTGLVTSLLFLLIDSDTGNAERGQRITREVLQLASGLSRGFSSSAGLLGLVALCVFAAQTAQEYSYGTLRNLLVREPRRIRLLLGKYFSMVAFALITVAISAITSIALAYGLAGRAKVDTSAWLTSDAQANLFHTFVNVLISTIGYGTIGMILGILLRSPISSISIGVGWLLVVESIIALAWQASANWMPAQLLAIVASGGTSLRSQATLDYSQALIRVVIYIVLASVGAGYLFKKRDVSN